MEKTISLGEHQAEFISNYAEYGLVIVKRLNHE